MSEQISVGDLVVVVRSHCAGFESEAGGVMFVVERLVALRLPFCSHCKGRLGPNTPAAESGDWSIPLQFLKRIPPLSELEGSKKKEDIREPA